MPNATSYTPTAADKFTFGLWTVGNRGRDPFGEFVRPTLDPVSSARGLVDSLALAPDAGLVATGERGGQIRVWATAGEPASVSLGSYRQAVVDLAFSPDGRLLASIGRHRESALRLWRPDDRAGPGAWTEAASLPIDRCLALRAGGSDRFEANR